MARLESMTISQFMSRDYNDKQLIDHILAHLKKHRIKYQVIGFTLVIFAIGGFDGSAFASSGIDAGGRRIYGKLLELGKWIIIIKGGFDSINQVVRGDFDSAKKNFLSYLLVYVILLALPWSLNQVESVFKGL